MAINTSKNFKNIIINFITNGESIDSDTLNRPVSQLKSLLEGSSFKGGISSIAIPIKTSELSNSVKPNMCVKVDTDKSIFEPASTSTAPERIIGIVNGDKTSIVIGGLYVDDTLNLKTSTLYYVQDDGTLGTKTTKIFAGIGLDKNTLLLKL